MQIKSYFLILMTLFISLAHGKTDIKWKSLHLINGCRIFDMEGKFLKIFPGQICIFLDDGSFIAANEKVIRRISKDNEILWEKPGHFHHQVNLSPDKKRILALTSVNYKVNGTDNREDKFLILSLDGNILHEQTATRLIEHAKIPFLKYPMPAALAESTGMKHELSHFNSFYEIPALKNKTVAPFIKAGNIVLNSVELGVFILAPDLSKVLHHTVFKNSIGHNVHDVQVTAEGNFLFYNNLAEEKKVKDDITIRHTEINEIRPITQKMVQTFKGNPEQLFFSLFCGNVQELNKDLWLFTHFLNGTYIYSKSGRKIVTYLVETHVNEERFIPSQQVTATDLTSFLSHWKN